MGTTGANSAGESAAEASFTVIIAVFNAADILPACLASIAAQTHDALQLIVIDGGSTDATVDVLRSNEPPIDHWISEPDQGITDAWNKALPHATGDWLLFLGADDRLAGPDLLARAGAELSEIDTAIRIAYGSVRVVRDDGTTDRVAGQPWAEARAALGYGMPIPHQGTFHHRSLFEQYGPFDERYQIVADYDFVLRELLEHDAYFMSDLIVTDMAAGGISDDPDSPVLTRELHRVWYEHGLRSAPPYREPAVLRSYLREWTTRIAGPEREASLTRAYRRLLRRPPR